jgi:hypothetical protein
MTLKEAVRNLKTRNCSMHEQAASAAFVHSYYSTEGRHLLKPVRFTTDAKSGRVVMRDQEPPKPKREETARECVARLAAEGRKLSGDSGAVVARYAAEWRAQQDRVRTRDAPGSRQRVRDEVRRDERWSRRMLAGINRANAAFWERNSHHG